MGVAVRLLGGLELDAGSPAVVEEVLHLAGDLLVRQRGRKEKVSKNLEEEAEGRAEVSGCSRAAKKTGLYRTRARAPFIPDRSGTKKAVTAFDRGARARARATQRGAAGGRVARARDGRELFIPDPGRAP